MKTPSLFWQVQRVCLAGMVCSVSGLVGSAVMAQPAAPPSPPGASIEAPTPKPPEKKRGLLGRIFNDDNDEDDDEDASKGKNAPPPVTRAVAVPEPGSASEASVPPPVAMPEKKRERISHAVTEKPRKQVVPSNVAPPNPPAPANGLQERGLEGAVVPALASQMPVPVSSATPAPQSAPLGEEGPDTQAPENPKTLATSRPVPAKTSPASPEQQQLEATRRELAQLQREVAAVKQEVAQAKREGGAAGSLPAAQSGTAALAAAKPAAASSSQTALPLVQPTVPVSSTPPQKVAALPEISAADSLPAGPAVTSSTTNPNPTSASAPEPRTAVAGSEPPPPRGVTQQDTTPKPGADGEALLGIKTEDPNFVKSPYPPHNQLDVVGLKPGTLARDPTTKKIFRVP